MAPNNTNLLDFLHISPSEEDDVLIGAVPCKHELHQEHHNSKKEIGHSVWRSMEASSIENGSSSHGRTLEFIPEPATHSIIHGALSSIRVLDNQSCNEEWLKKYHGTLHSLPRDLIESVAAAAPKQFGARVADFNENLFYEMQTQLGLSHLGMNDPRLASCLGTEDFLGSFLTTESTLPQPAHVDYTWEVLEEQGSNLSIGFFPLTQQGMYLQVWQRNDDVASSSHIQGELIYVPFGYLLILPASTIHGGGFRTTPERNELGVDQKYGNLRFHLYIPTSTVSQENNPTGLPKHQTNKYTEPFDKRRELCERYVDAPCLRVLQEYFFV